MTTGGTQSNWSEGERLSEEPERGTIAALVALGGLVRRREVAPERGTIVGLVALGGLVRRRGEVCASRRLPLRSSHYCSASHHLAQRRLHQFLALHGEYIAVEGLVLAW